ncbi:MAG: 2-oxo-4-hydroxy-4-carboxy-5-ureidoimidazoline decarboxylase [Candidatus Obscuribacterales bacterium]|nr:2-oxo-4-hydroxy-4-carboxy-5-ureidoimidazoline decarboxylase [Candidatus Obscuribacterales bacterium]
MELHINKLTAHEAAEAFNRCCGSKEWVTRMLAKRPFPSIDSIFESAKEIWWQLDRKDWLEAFSHHPKIGDLDSLKKKFAGTADLAASEQASVNAAREETLQALAKGNKEYEDKFGYIFIVCATGKSPEEMLSLLQSRLPNNDADEIKIAAEEQSKITRLRLERICQ